MIKKVKTYRDLPLEEGKIYKTKLSTGENFLIKKIIFKEYGENRVPVGLEGIWENHPNAGICPLPLERLIPEREETGEIEVCSNCGEPIK